MGTRNNPWNHWKPAQTGFRSFQAFDGTVRFVGSTDFAKGLWLIWKSAEKKTTENKLHLSKRKHTNCIHEEHHESDCQSINVRKWVLYNQFFCWANLRLDLLQYYPIVHPVPLDKFSRNDSNAPQTSLHIACQRVMLPPVFSGFSWESAQEKNDCTTGSSYKLRHEIDINSLGCFLKWWVKSPQIIHGLIGFSIIFTTSILGYHYFWKHSLTWETVHPDQETTFRTVNHPKKNGGKVSTVDASFLGGNAVVQIRFSPCFKHMFHIPPHTGTWKYPKRKRRNIYINWKVHGTVPDVVVYIDPLLTYLFGAVPCILTISTRYIQTTNFEVHRMLMFSFLPSLTHPPHPPAKTPWCRMNFGDLCKWSCQTSFGDLQLPALKSGGWISTNPLSLLKKDHVSLGKNCQQK